MLSHSPSIVTDGLVLCLDAANPRSYGGSGTNWGDLSGNGNNGTLVNGPTFNTGSLGSIQFDGVNDYAELNSDIILGESFTISILYKQTSTRSDWVRLFGHSNDTVDRYWGIWMPVYRNYLLWQSYKNGGSVTTPSFSFNINTFYKIDLTCIGSLKKIYINGSLFHSAYSGGVIDYTGNNSKISIGYAGFHTYFIGNIYSAQIYNRDLTPQEIEQNFKATRGRFGI